MSKNSILDVSLENYKDLENKFFKLQSENANLKVKAALYDSLNERFSVFKEKALFVFSFLNFLGINSCVYGSFVRKLFDFSLRFDEIKNINTGSLENSDINVIFMNSLTFDKQQSIGDYYKTINNLVINKLMFYSDKTNICTKVSSNDKNESKLFKFNDFTFIDLNYDDSVLDKNNHLNPKATLLFRKIKNESQKVIEIKVNMFCFRLTGSPNHENFPDFTNNMYSLNINGIFKNYNVCNNSITNYNFYEYLNLIANNEIKNIKNLKLLQNYAFPEDGTCIPRELKLKWLRQIYEVISTCYLKNLDNGFNLIGEYVPNIFISKVEDCPITNTEAPYPSVTLECEHNLSLMAYRGIIENSDCDDSERILCPYCRNDLKIKFINKKQSTKLELNTINFNYPLGNIIQTNKCFATLNFNKDVDKQL